MAKESVRDTSSFETKKSARLEQVLTNVTVSEVDECPDWPETIQNVLIDLVQLENRNSNFTIFNVPKEALHKVGNFNGSNYILADKQGYHIQNMQEVW